MLTTAPAFRRTLRYTLPLLAGEDVRQLQCALRRADPDAARAIQSVDGLFGPATARAVRVFQQKQTTAHGLAPDGIVGPLTWGAVFAAAQGTDLPAAIRATAAAASPAGLLTEHLPQLTSFHAVFSGGRRWRLTPHGVEPEGDTPPTAPPDAIRNLLAWFGDAFRAEASATGLPLELLLACAATETAGDTRRFPTAQSAAQTLREEPGFLDDETTPHRVSPGLMQTLLSTARETLNRPLSRADLLDPATSIAAGAGYILRQAPLTRLDPPCVACAYNAGGLYEQRGPSNHWRLRQYPIGTPNHADRFVRFFNTALGMLSAEPALAGSSPTFAAVLNG